MWWDKRIFPVLLLPLLAGCGFHPLYSRHGVDPRVLDELASIRVAPMPDRQGQLIHNDLISNLSPDGEPVNARYQLVVHLSINESQGLILPDETATRDTLFYQVKYFLYEGSTAITAGNLTQVYSYDFLQQQYANIAAEDDIKRRSAQAIADEIRNRLAAYFIKAAENRAPARN